MADHSADRDPGAAVQGAPPFPVVRRGYDRAQVDDYLVKSQAELIRLAAETRALNATIARLTAEISAPRGDQPAAADPLETWRSGADELFAGARADIERIVAAAKSEAEALRQAARDEVALLHIELAERHEGARLAAVEARRAADAASDSTLAALHRVLTTLDELATLTQPGGDVAPEAEPAP